MIPIRDNISSRTTPFINYILIVLTAWVFLSQMADATLIERFGMIPARVTEPGREIIIQDAVPVRTPGGIRYRQQARPAAAAAVPSLLTLFTCIFLHGGWMHFLGNMWFLWIFGDNVEDRFGHLGFLIFYLGAGVAASLAHLLSNPQSMAPTIGASGAIAGVMGAYLYLYPRAKVLTVIPIFFYLHMLVLPAPFFLGFWFLLQFFQGVLTLSSAQAGGVAWWAHIGGFVVGFAIAALLGRSDRLSPKVEVMRPHTERLGHYRVRPPWES